MALSVIVIPGDGVTTQHSIPFALGYIREQDITCQVGDEVDGTGNPVYRNLTFLSDEVVEVSGTPAAIGQNYTFRRTVDRTELLVDYEDGAIQNEDNLNTAQKQALMLVHEVLDGRFEQFQSDVSLGGFTFTDVGDPIDPQDVANKRYVDARLQLSAQQVADAQAARDVAVSAAAASSTSQGNASAAATAAANSETSAAASQVSALASANTASTKAGEALASQVAAGGSATAAGTSATAAQAARDLAQKWATENEDVVVSGGQYSARHHAIKSAASAANAAADRALAVTAKDQAVTARNEAVAARTLLAGGSTGQLLGKSSNADYAYQWITLTGGGDMLKAMYDPTNKQADAFAWANFTGVPAAFPPTAHTHTAAQITDLKSNAKRDLTVSTGAPTGGVDGDVWYKI